ncbi:MAG: glycosyltransferase family 39 protein [bacterium]
MFYILGLAAVLRLVLINQSLWLDEAIEALALRGHFGPILSYALSDFQPPLYHLLGLAWTRLFGFSEIALRTPSLLAGLVLVYFVFKLGELIGTKKLAIIASLLVATNPLLIYYSGEGRTYILTTLLVTASFYYLVLSLRRRTLSSIIHYSLFITLTLWTSYLSWFVALSQGIYLICKKRWDLLAALALAVSSLLLWLPSLLRSLAIGVGDARTIPGWGQVVGGTSLKALALTWVKMNIGRISFDNKLLYGLIVSLIGLLHLSIFRKMRPLTIDHRPLLIWLIAPVVLASIVSVWVPIYSYTRVLFIVPAYLLLLSLALVQLPIRYTALVLSLNLLFLSLFWFNPRFHREDWRSLTSYLNAQEGTVVLPSLKQDAPFIYYNLTLPLQSTLDPVDTKHVYYVKYVEDTFDPGHLGPANLARLGYTISSQRTYPGIAVDIYAKK